MPNILDALKLFYQRDWQRAEQICHNLISQNSQNLEALSLLGTIAQQRKDYDSAINYYQKVLSYNPLHLEARNNLGVVLQDLGRLEEAIAQYNNLLLFHPQNVAALYNLGNILLAQNNFLEALGYFEQALPRSPRDPQIFCNLGIVLLGLNRHEEAIVRFQQAITFDSRAIKALNNLANLLQERGEFAKAIAYYQQILALTPEDGNVHYNLGNALRGKGQLKEAIIHYQKALDLQPELAIDIHTNLGLALKDASRMEEAIASFQTVLRLKPSPEAYANLGDVYLDRGERIEALSNYEQALDLDPECAHARCHRGYIWLLQGELATGFLEYTEYLWRSLLQQNSVQSFTQPIWNGSELGGKTILIYIPPALGFGDSIQFIRYLPQVKAKGGKIVLNCPSALYQLFSDNQASLGIDRLVLHEEKLPEFDSWAFLLALPQIMRTTLDNIPHAVPYLSASESGEISASTPSENKFVKVGIVWSGAPRYRNIFRDRSCTLSHFLPLLKIPHMQFYSLQTGDPALELAQLDRAEFCIDELGSKFKNFADTAVAIAELDLIVTIDTAVAHLAGAVAKPVWVLLPFTPDCRWMLERSDSPWYPTMRLFRQSQPGNWEDVFSEVYRELSALSLVRDLRT